tara:strand:- start:1078 stop:2607 length:1530 start_codon:yes stop_codon:yes gene_type:complete
MQTPFLGQSYVARSVNAANSRMVNLFPEATPENGKSIGFLTRAPGLRELTTVGSGPIRGLWTFNGVGFVVSGNELYRMPTAWSATLIGSVTGSGPVSMADNGIQLFIACNPDGYIYNNDTGVFAQILDPEFPGAVTVGYIDGYFVFNEPNSQKIWVTSLLNGTQVDPLDFASAEGSPDDLVSLMVDHREVWLFGSNSIEVWYDAGLSDFPLARIQGAFNEIGCAAAYSVAKLDNALFWLGSDARGNGIVYRANGYTGQRVSTHAVEWQIQQYANISDAVAFTYQQEGHAFYVLNFPSANTTWVFDVATNAWHERAYWGTNSYLRHRANSQMNLFGEIVVGDYFNSKIYAFDTEYYSDDDNPQRWLRSWRALPPDGNSLVRTSHHSLQLDCETGVGLVETSSLDEYPLQTESGATLLTESGLEIVVSQESGYAISNAPKVMLRWSDDGGHTWSNEHWTDIGKIGEYGRRAIWRRLGMTMKLRDRVYEISGTDPVKITLIGAELKISATAA